VHVTHYLALLHRSQVELRDAFRQVADAHTDEADVVAMCNLLAKQCDHHAERLQPFVARYREEHTAGGGEHEPERLHSELFKGTRSGPLGLMRDLHDLYLMAAECDVVWTLIGQAAQGLRDRELLEVVTTCESETARQLDWIRERVKQAAPQALVVAR
jgi:hypothetical protein